MATRRLIDFRRERNGFMESIFESTNFLKRIYSDKDESDNLKMMYKLERERLIRILKRYRDLFTRYRPTLLKLSDKGSEEVSVCEGLIRGALDVIDGAPSHLRKLKYVTAKLNHVDVQVVKEVKPEVVNVVNEITEVVLTTVKRNLLEVPKCVVVLSTLNQNIKPPAIAKKPRIQVPVWPEIIPSTVIVGKSDVNLIGLKHCSSSKENCPFINEVYDDCELVVYPKFSCTGHNENLLKTREFGENKVRRFYVQFIFSRLYCKIFMRFFWSYFLFSDFCDFSVNIILVARVCLFYVCFGYVWSRIFILDGGVCYCRRAAVCI